MSLILLEMTPITPQRPTLVSLTRIVNPYDLNVADTNMQLTRYRHRFYIFQWPSLQQFVETMNCYELYKKSFKTNINLRHRNAHLNAISFGGVRSNIHTHGASDQCLSRLGMQPELDSELRQREPFIRGCWLVAWTIRETGR